MALTAPLERHEIAQRKIGGGQMAWYMTAPAVLRRLIDATGNCFSVSVLETSESPSVNRDGVIVGRTMTARVALSIPGLGTREHLGVQTVDDRGGEDLVKGAITDGIKKAATLFGLALELQDDDWSPPAEARAGGVSPSTSGDRRAGAAHPSWEERLKSADRSLATWLAIVHDAPSGGHLARAQQLMPPDVLSAVEIGKAVSQRAVELGKPGKGR